MRDYERPQRVVRDEAAGVANNVRVSRLQSEHGLDIESRVHAGYNGKLLGRWHSQAAEVERRGVI